MLIAFIDNDGIIHEEFVPTGQAGNVTFNGQVLKLLLKRVRCDWKWMLLTDNAPAHCVIRVRQFLVQRCIYALSPTVLPRSGACWLIYFSWSGEHLERRTFCYGRGTPATWDSDSVVDS
ncbi:hypothetical protein PR048_024851 [Dryococelus australis]|uniref:Transposase n=1 Tax=Dryococelus australis TaxID=614101 RepID=A0ABQ9GPT9_9NEOP|nr:hypothetical protein PR048_024851 [Dryococelus australis]